jgi:hypothetical protein
MAISVIDPIGPAIEHTQRILFRPFDLGKWFVLGFCAWLAQLGEGGTNLNFQNPFNFPGPGGQQAPRPGPGPVPPPGPPPEFRQAMDWILAHLGLVIGLGLAFLLVVVAIGLVLTWVRCRGMFMFLDGIARNRAAVAEPWREYAREGNSLFGFVFLFGLAIFVGFLVIVGGAAGIALPDIRAGQFGTAAATALWIGVPLFVLFLLATGVVNLFLSDFVVPIMYLRRQGVMTSWRIFHRSILTGHVGTFILYWLFQIVMAIALGFMTILFCCGSLCLALVPYLGTVITLPLLVFRRAYGVLFLEQFGPEWQIISSSTKPPGPPQWEVGGS